MLKQLAKGDKYHGDSDAPRIEIVKTHLRTCGAIQIVILGQLTLSLGGEDSLFEVSTSFTNAQSDGVVWRHLPNSMLDGTPLFWTGRRVLRAVRAAWPTNACAPAVSGFSERRRLRLYASHLNKLIQAHAPAPLLKIYAGDPSATCAETAQFWHDIYAWNKTFSESNFHWRKMAPILARMGFPPHSQLDSLMQGLQEEVQSAGNVSRGTFQALCGIKNLAPFVCGGQLNKKMLKALDAVVRSKGKKSAIRLFDAMTPESLFAINDVLDKLVTLAWLDEGIQRRKIALQFLTMSLDGLMQAALFNQRYDSFLSVDLHHLVSTIVPGSTLVPVLDLKGWAAKTIVVDRYLKANDFFKNSTFESLHSKALELRNTVPPGLVTGWPVPLPATVINGIVFEPIETVVDLLIEARRQGSCLDKYGRKAASGHAFFYRLQATSASPFVETATVEYCRTGESGGLIAISEIRGKKNCEVSPALVTAAQKFAEMIEKALQVDLHGGII